MHLLHICCKHICCSSKACQCKRRDGWESSSELLQHSSSSVVLSVSPLARGCCRPRTPAFLQFTFRIVHLSTSTRFVPSRFSVQASHRKVVRLAAAASRWKADLWQGRRDLSRWIKIRESPESFTAACGAAFLPSLLCVSVPTSSPEFK